MNVKTTTLTSLLGLAMVFTPAFAEDDDKPERRDRKGPPKAFRKLDEDGDKAVSEEEAGKHWKRLSHRDANDDGRVTARELRRSGRGKDHHGKGKRGRGDHHHRKGKRGDHLWNLADDNDDGKISEGEVPVGAWKRLSRLDANDDGSVTKEEFRAAAKDRGKRGKRGARLLKRADENDDGKISEDEVSEGAWKRLSRHDANDDGAVSKKELRAAAKKGRKECSEKECSEKEDSTKDGADA